MFWSSVGGKSYPIPIRVFSFEGLYKALDPDYNQPGTTTAAQELRVRFASALASAQDNAQSGMLTEADAANQSPVETDEAGPEQEHDVLSSYEDAAIRAFRGDEQFLDRLRRHGIPWRGVQEHLKNALPSLLSDRDGLAYKLVPKAMNQLFGKQDSAWKTEKRPARSGNGYTTWIVITSADAQTTAGSAID